LEQLNNPDFNSVEFDGIEMLGVPGKVYLIAVKESFAVSLAAIA
jgi:hypothetical protein